MRGVTVVIPAYQAEPFLAATLDSVRAQSVAPERVIVIDDGSRDASAEIARRHVVGADVVVRANAGQAVARNHGAHLADTQWLAFLDCDDLWHHRHLELALDTADRAGADMVATGSVSFVAADGSDPGPRARWADRRCTDDELAAALVQPLDADFGFAHVDPLRAAITGVTPTASTVLVSGRRSRWPVAFRPHSTRRPTLCAGIKSAGSARWS